MRPTLLSVSPARTRPVFLRRGFWLVVVALLVTVGAIRLLKPGPPPADLLHGDSDEAMVGLDHALARTPAAQKTALLLHYAQDASPGLRDAAIEALGMRHEPEAVNAVETAFRDSSATVREHVLESLPDLAPERGLRLLTAALYDPDTQIRTTALTQLKVRQRENTAAVYRSLVPSLIVVLDDPESGNTLMAMQLLHKITGNNWGAKFIAAPDVKQAAIRRWKIWWANARADWKTAPEYQSIVALPPTRTDPAPDFDLRDIDGKPIRLADQHGRVTLLNFWGTWCPPCQQEIPDLVKISRLYRGRPVSLVGIALSETSVATLRAGCQKRGVLYSQVMAPDSVLNAYGNIHEVPVTVLIDGRGRIRYRWEGLSDFNTFRAAIDTLLKEQGN